MTPPIDNKCQRSGQLLKAVEEGNINAVKVALSTAPVDVNASFGAVQITVLQLAASLGDEGLDIVKLLLHHGANPNLRDKIGRGPLHHAAISSAPAVMQILLDAGAVPNIYFQVGNWSDEENAVCCTNSNSRDVSTKLKVPDCWGRTPLHQAVKGNNPSCVQLLLNAGAIVDVRDEHAITPLLLAGSGINCKDKDAIEKYEQILHLLGTANADVNCCDKDTGMTALHHAVLLQSINGASILLRAGAKISAEPNQENTPLHEAAGTGCVEMVQLLLQKGGQALVNVPDQVGRTPMHKAAYGGHRDVLAMLLYHGGDLAAITKSNITVIDAIFANIPRPVNFLTDIMDECVKANNASVNDRNYKITLDFSPLCPGGEHQQMAVVSALMNGCSGPQLAQVFQHPLLELFIRTKWYKLRAFFMVLMAVQVAFVFTLSTYVVMSVHLDVDGTKLVGPGYVLLSTSVVLLLYVVGQLVLLPRHYLREAETWLHVISAALAMAVVITSRGGKTSHGSDPGDNTTGVDGKSANDTMVSSDLPHSSLHMLSVAVMLAWVELMLLLSRFPTWGYYALMFQAVLTNVLKVLLAFICLVLGFAFSFSVQFHEQQWFSDPWRAVVKTTVMLMGEFEYGELLGTAGQNRLPVTSRMVFMGFVVLGPLVLMNLMVGLAVSDIQALQTEGHTRRLLKQADFVTHLEALSGHMTSQTRFIPWRLHQIVHQRRCIATTLVVQPMNTTMPGKLLDNMITLASRSSHHLPQSNSSMMSDRYMSVDWMASTCTPVAIPAVLEALADIRHHLTDIQQLLEADRNRMSWQFHRHRRFSNVIREVRTGTGVLRNLKHKSFHSSA